MDAALARLPGVPGITLTVVVDDEVVLARGYGFADAERTKPSDGDTVYYIASCTKPFTALAAARLDARGAIDLDSPLSEHLHGVELDASLRPAEVRLRDLLTHTSGIVNGPITYRLAYTGEHDPATLWRLLARSSANAEAPLGTFDYTNVGYNILGMVLDRELDKPWQDLLAAEIFEPAGMARTTAYASRPAAQGWSVAAPCFGLEADGIRRQQLAKQDDTMQSAGGLMSTARDMGRWLELQLNDGRLDGEQVVEAAVLRATHARLVETHDDRQPFGRSAYGLGWFHGAFAGQPVLYHGGGFAGYRAVMSFMPDARIGVAVMTNEDTVAGMLLEVLTPWAYEWWLDLPESERRAQQQLDELVSEYPEVQQRWAETAARLAERTWQLARPRADYAGTFENELVGTLVIALVGDALEVRAGRLHCVATPYPQAESMRVELVPRHGQVALFQPAEGAVERVVIDGDVFERVR